MKAKHNIVDPSIWVAPNWVASCWDVIIYGGLKDGLCQT